MTINSWEPIRDLVTLREAMNKLFEESFVRPPTTRWLRARAQEGRCDLPLDAYVTPDDLIIVAQVPGLSPEDVEITIEGDTLSIKGEFKTPAEDVDYMMQERHYGRFCRTLRLNIPVQPDKAEAVFDKGVLVLTIPKAEEVKPKIIKIKAK